MYKVFEEQINLAKLQEEVIAKWKRENSFKESIKNREGAKEFVFYDGPPFANGLPHYGHLLTSYVKDSVARFQTMIGNKVERRFGWDCHGLPAEMETEKELKVSGRTQIIEYGIEKFNNSCRASVMKYAKQWQEYIEKAGRWVDFNEDYKTMDAPYMESVLWGFEELYKKGLVYEDFRVMPYSWKCETPLSNFETRMDNSYRLHTSKALTVKFKLKNNFEGLEGYKLFAAIWTTTPWTLPSNLALAVNKNLDYVFLKTGEHEATLLAKNLASKYEKELGVQVLLEIKGAGLEGVKYQPLFNFFENYENAFKIILADFVEEEGGTGIVHIAPGFGEDDYLAAKQAGIKVLCPVDDGGKFTNQLYPYISFEAEHVKFEDLEEKHNGLIKSLLEHHEEMHFEGAEKSYHFYQKHKAKFGAAPMAVVLKETGEAIGIAGLLAHDDKLPLAGKNAEVLCFLKPEFQGKGLGQEVFKFFAKFAFTKFGVNEVLAVIFGKNPASVKALKSIGFEDAGEVQDARSKILINKFVLKKHPKSFKTRHLEFKKEGSMNFERKLGKDAYFIYNEGKIIGAAEVEGEVLDYIFLEGVNEALIEEALKEMILRFAYFGVKTKHHITNYLKNLGFFETKQEDGTKILRRPTDVLNLAGKQVFDGNDDIISFLKLANRVIRQEQYIHNYPHCWRTDTPLIYKAVSSWYVAVSTFRDKMVELNKEINWVPNHIRDGQFGKWLENARDWSITRNRFWGTPVPVWKVHDENNEEIRATHHFFPTLQELRKFLGGIEEKRQNILSKFKKNEFWNIRITSEKEEEVFFFPKVEEALKFEGFAGTFNGFYVSTKRNYVFGSKQELNEFFGSEIEDLHRPFIDELTMKDPYNEKHKIVRVSDVLDCWFESGSMPFASVHYPFENKQWFETHNPADFIVEYVGQTRGWFYTLVVLSTALFGRVPFKNCLCHGVILDENGQKLSKRLRNYPDPLEVFETYGSDAMRFFLLSSPVVLGGDLRISKDGKEIRDVVRLVIKPIWNAYSFFAMYANADLIKAKYDVTSQNVMDKYIFSKLALFALDMKLELESYNFPNACKKIEEFIDVLNNWYIRRNKERFWKEAKDEDKLSAYNTFYTVLLEFSKVVSPILPFTSESLFDNLSNPS